MPKANKDFVFTRMLLCEGPDDAIFSKRLVEQRGLPRFHIRDTSDDNDPHGGNTKFGRTLKSLRLNNAFRRLKNIVIVSDNDSDPNASFANICAQIEKEGFGPAPVAELARSMAHPSITIVMVPLGQQQGTLESILVHAAHRRSPIVGGHVNQFMALLDSNAWSPSRRGKAWLRSLLAGRCERDPFVTLYDVFADRRLKTDNLIPLSDGSFNRLANILSNIP